MYQKDAILRQLQEFRSLFDQENKNYQNLLNQLNGLKALLLFIFEGLKMNPDDCPDFGNLLESINAPNQPWTDYLEKLSSYLGLKNPEQLNQLLMNSQSGSVLAYIDILKNQIEDLKHSFKISERNRLRLEAEYSKVPKITTDNAENEPDSSPDTKESLTNPQDNSDLLAINAELDALKMISEARLYELKKISQERDHYKVNFDNLNSQFRRIPEEYFKNPRKFEEMSDDIHHYRMELQEHKKALDDLEKHVGEAVSKRSHRISTLESSLSEKRYAIQDFASNMEADINRLRKDRDSMRELYESINMQLSSVTKQNAHLTTLNEQLSNKLSLNEQKLGEIFEKLKSGDEAMLLSELESIGEAFDSVQKQNAQLIKQIGEKDQVITRLTNEKLKSEFGLVQAQREADLTKQKANKIEMDSLKTIEEAEINVRQLRQNMDQTEKELIDKRIELEASRIKCSEYISQISDLKRQIENQMPDQIIVEKLKEFERALFEKKRLEEQLQITTAKLNAYVSSAQGSVMTKDLQEELEIYKKLMKCNSCHIREKGVVLLKCMHVFCKECIDTRLETRQRKCPNCGESFGANDVRPIYL